jgi:hypothetical protein
LNFFDLSEIFLFFFFFPFSAFSFSNNISHSPILLFTPSLTDFLFPHLSLISSTPYSDILSPLHLFFKENSSPPQKIKK